MGDILFFFKDEKVDSSQYCNPIGIKVASSSSRIIPVGSNKTNSIVYLTLSAVHFHGLLYEELWSYT